MVEWLGSCAFSTKGMCLIHDQGTKISQSCAAQQKNKTKHKITTKRKLREENTRLISFVSVSVEDNS